MITLTHELAHLATWQKYGRRVRPHGKAWKSQYASMLAALLEKGVFPEEISPLVWQQVKNPKANSHGNTELVRRLHGPEPDQQGMFLEDLPAGALFSLPGGRKFRKQEKLRKWYRCISQDNHRAYRISPVARVLPLEN
ncbi:MAG: SprT-like domain-containing protein [Bacteroidales bacterium]|nr:SprT-like domain-containing protein [Bacteroidales bacterium]